MISIRVRRVLLALVVVAAASAGPGGCASSMQAPDPVSGLDQIAGRWQGLISFPGRFDQLIYLTVASDGRLFAVWGSNQAWGTATVEGGKARFQMAPPPFEGDLNLYGTGGDRSVVMRELWGSFIARLTPQK